MSVSMTLPAVEARVKTVTRRRSDTWTDLAAGEPLALIEKGMGLPKGAHQVVVAVVDVVSVSVVPLWPIHWPEIRAEGLWEQFKPLTGPLSPSQAFCRFWLKGHGFPADTDPARVMVRRIEWAYRLTDEEVHAELLDVAHGHTRPPVVDPPAELGRRARAFAESTGLAIAPDFRSPTVETLEVVSSPWVCAICDLSIDAEPHQDPAGLGDVHEGCCRYCHPELRAACELGLPSVADERQLARERPGNALDGDGPILGHGLLDRDQTAVAEAAGWCPR